MKYANLTAERIVQLRGRAGGTAEGTAHAVAGRSSLDGYRLARADGNAHIGALSTTLTNVGRHARYASEQANELKDADAADLASTHSSGSSRRASNQTIEHSCFI